MLAAASLSSDSRPPLLARCAWLSRLPPRPKIRFLSQAAPPFTLSAPVGAPAAPRTPPQ